MQRWIRWTRENWAAFFMIGLFLFANIFWIYQDNAYPFWDEADYMANSFILWNSLWQDPFLTFLIKLLRVSSVKPPLISVLPFPIYFILGISAQHALLAISGCLLVFNLAFYEVIRKAYGRGYGFLGVAIINTMPLFFGMARIFFMEIPLLLLVFLFFVLWRNFENLRKYQGWLMALVAVGVLFKPHFLLYIFAILVFYGYWNRGQWVDYVRRCLKIFGVGLGVGLLWYLPNLLSFMRFVFYFFTKHIGDMFDPTLKTIHTSGNFLFLLTNQGFGFFYLALIGLLAGAGLCLRKPRAIADRPDDRLPAAWIAFLFVTFFIMFLFKYKNPRYALPVFPFLVLAMVIMLKDSMTQLKLQGRRWWRQGLGICVGALVALSFVQALSLTFKGIDHASWRLGKFVLFPQDLQEAYRPRNFKYPLEQIMQTIHRRNPRGGRRKVLLLFDCPYLNMFSLRLVTAQLQLPYTIRTAAYKFDPSPEGILPEVLMDDYVVISAEQNDPAYTNAFTRARSEYFAHCDFLVKIGSFDTPDNKSIEVYANKDRDAL